MRLRYVLTLKERAGSGGDEIDTDLSEDEWPLASERVEQDEEQQ